MGIIKESKKDIFMLVLFILFGFVGIHYYVLASFSSSIGLDEKGYIMLANAISPIIVVLIGCFLFRKELLEGLYFFKEKTMYKILGVFGFLVVDIIVSYLNSVFLMDPKSTSNETSMVEQATAVPFIWTVLTIAIAGPLLEELIFRHILIGRLSKYINVYVASIFSVLLFSIAHTSQLNEIFVYLPGSIIFTIAYLVSKKSIIYPIIIHMILNFLSCLGDLIN